MIKTKMVTMTGPAAPEVYLGDTSFPVVPIVPGTANLIIVDKVQYQVAGYRWEASAMGGEALLVLALHKVEVASSLVAAGADVLDKLPKMRAG